MEGDWKNDMKADKIGYNARNSKFTEHDWCNVAYLYLSFYVSFLSLLYLRVLHVFMNKRVD